MKDSTLAPVGQTKAPVLPFLEQAPDDRLKLMPHFTADRWKLTIETAWRIEEIASMMIGPLSSKRRVAYAEDLRNLTQVLHAALIRDPIDASAMAQQVRRMEYH